MHSFDKPLTGIIPPLATPLTDRDAIDEAGTERLINHVLDGGVTGIFVLGTTGEAPSLSYRLRKHFIRLACNIVNERVPVLVGITDTAFMESLSVADAALNAGANAVVVSTPYYFPAGQTELTQYVEHLLDELPLPLMLYNIPSLTKVAFEIETIGRLADHKGIAGVKDSGGDLDYFKELVKFKDRRPDWTILVGPEHLLGETVRLGGHGGVNGGANIFPKLFTSMYRAAANGDTDRVTVLQQQIDALQAIYSIGKYNSSYLKGLKCALSIKGICSDHMAEPFNRFFEPERSKVAAILETINVSP